MTPKPSVVVNAIAHATVGTDALRVALRELRANAHGPELIAAYVRMARENLESALAVLKDQPGSADDGPDRDGSGCATVGGGGFVHVPIPRAAVADDGGDA